MKKTAFDLLFIVFSAAILLLLNHFGYLEQYIAFALIPILAAYLLGQYSQKKFGLQANGEGKS